MIKHKIFMVVPFFSAIISGCVSQPVKTADESVTVVARIYVAPGREAEAEARLIKLHEFVMKAEPNITYRFYHSKKDPTLFVTYEIYPNEAAAGQHMKVLLPSFGKEAGPTPVGLYTRPPEFEFLNEIGK